MNDNRVTRDANENAVTWFRRPAEGDAFVGATQPTDPVLQPIETSHQFFEGVPQRPSFCYGIFNPMGPTWNLITLVEGRRGPGERAYLVCHRMLNPFASANTLWASIPIQTSDDGIVATVVRLFAANGSEAYPLLGSMPTWLLPATQSGGLGQAAEPALRTYAATYPTDLRASTSEFREYLGRPWDRLTANQDAAREFLRTHPLTGPDLAETNTESSGVEKGQGDGDHLDEWLQVMLDPRHCEPEMTAALQAWDGAIEFQIESQGGEARTRAIFPDIMMKDELLEALRLAGF